jgi:hypothetical protein
MQLSAQQRRVAFGVIIFLSVVFAIVVPFAPKQVARIGVFIPVIQSLICFADLITAVFLFAQYSIQPQRALLALASGYIFSGLFAFLQTLDFPGAYSAAGLLGGNPSGAAWLFSFWHITFPLCVIAYVLLKDKSENLQHEKQEPLRVIAITIVCVLAVTAALTWLGTAGAANLPALFTDTMRQTPFVQNFAGAMWLLNAVALMVLLARNANNLDVWLVVTIFASLPDLSLSFFYVVLLCRSSVFCWLVHRTKLCTNRKLYGLACIARGNNDALCATCERDDFAAARAYQSAYECGRGDGRSRT